MSLPALFLDELRQRTPMLQLVGRRVRLVRSGRQTKGCCPFHGEKTPSFYVYEDHYHCFGCGAHGDAVSFVMAAQGLSFLEAVAELAADAGLTVPKDEAGAATRAQQTALADVLGAARAQFVRWLYEPGGATARDYLLGRGLTPTTIAEFGIGWSGPRGALSGAINAPIGAMIDAGLMTRRDDGIAIDFFRDRVMFPICAQGGQVVSFGGRTLGVAQPKYINGPETALYAKRRTLFGLDKAREALAMGNRLVIVEGYLDAIAMHQAGEAGAVAPLGSALTEEQLLECWRLSPAPVLAFDGDAAGHRAVLHAMDVALPKLAPDRTISVAFLPVGEDPDSLIKTGGPAAMRAVLDAALPVDRVLATILRPEGNGPLMRALWRNRLADAVAAIADEQVATDIRRGLLDHYFDERQQQSGG